MSRRPHNKSRNGCFECKRRHVRCDGTRPICVNCAAAEIRCSFLPRDTPFMINHTILQVPSTRTPLSASEASTRENRDPYTVNMIHLQLFDNLSSKEFQVIEDPVEINWGLPISLFVHHALTAPFLMHALLAMSALHLSTKNTDLRSYYHEQATGLQNRALTLLKEAYPVLEVTPANCVPLFLFACCIAMHLLFDTLNHRKGDLDELLDGFTHFLTVYHGVLTIIQGSRHMLQDTELSLFLRSSRISEQPIDVASTECEAIREMLDDMEPSSAREAYLLATLRLQQLFTAHRTVPETTMLWSLVMQWPVIIPAEYTQKLQERQPEAIIILAHFVALLHRARTSWPVGDGARIFIEAISRGLGPSWQNWLRLPMDAIGNT